MMPGGEVTSMSYSSDVINGVEVEMKTKKGNCVLLKWASEKAMVQITKNEITGTVTIGKKS